ncbi:acylphosphatase-2-like [Teleopsis dalmanni]|uniref:acylphosphatase-2-like n=1 Tax=Teleopsis dalmanni TaxID=139649 RepID=UPI0018CD3B6A|nr:acylphosphatase-2-like [Teleopsis dalmanni]XP_037955221.1 acylphosphatase-2-like [Teleopsis dalmanni]
MATPIYTCDFKVLGKVNRAPYRRYAEVYGRKAGIRGWLMTSLYGSVQGQMEGTKYQLDKMKKWLRCKSTLVKTPTALFTNYKRINKHKYMAFYAG